jgi:hypothetical protein
MDIRNTQLPLGRKHHIFNRGTNGNIIFFENQLPRSKLTRYEAAIKFFYEASLEALNLTT